MAEDEPPPDELPTHSDDGVDLTLIRWMLSMSPAERLETLQQFVDCVMRVRAANAKE